MSQRPLRHGLCSLCKADTVKDSCAFNIEPKKLEVSIEPNRHLHYLELTFQRTDSYPRTFSCNGVEREDSITKK